LEQVACVINSGKIKGSTFFPANFGKICQKQAPMRSFLFPREF